jgi:hypothetical protein
LVLNTDYTPLSYNLLSLRPWQTTIKAVFLDKVDIVSSYDRHVHSPSLDIEIQTIIAQRPQKRRSGVHLVTDGAVIHGESGHLSSVAPAKAGAVVRLAPRLPKIPAFAGMTIVVNPASFCQSGQPS